MRSLVHRLGLGIALAATIGEPAMAADPIRVVLIEEHAGPNSVDGMHGDEGFRLGLDYATHGTHRVRGRPITVSAIVSRGAGDAADLLAAAYRDKADIAVAFGSSDAALAMLPVAASSRRILLVATARADAIAGNNRYVFRTAASAGQQALAEALALARPELNLFVAAEDTRDGADAVAALRQAWKGHGNGGFLIGARLVPSDATDVGDILSAEFDGLHDLHGAKVLLTVWSGASSPIPSIAAADPGRFGIKLAFAGDIDPSAQAPQAMSAGITSYFHTMPHNRANDRLIAAWRHRFKAHPDGAAAEGMTAAMALVAALKAAPAMDADTLVATMEGLHFATPKGGMIFRPEDHQASQVMYQFRREPHASAGAPVLEHEFALSELSPPIGPGR